MYFENLPVGIPVAIRSSYFDTFSFGWIVVKHDKVKIILENEETGKSRKFSVKTGQEYIDGYGWETGYHRSNIFTADAAKIITAQQQLRLDQEKAWEAVEFAAKHHQMESLKLKIFELEALLEQSLGG